jgi:serine/threonine protein kinase
VTRPGASPELQVELSVRAALYGERDEVTVTRTTRRPLRARAVGPSGRVVGGRYRLLRRVGAGAMADVYRARDERLKREVAVKLIS